MNHEHDNFEMSTLSTRLALTMGSNTSKLRPMFSKISCLLGDFEASTILWVFSLCTYCKIILKEFGS